MLRNMIAVAALSAAALIASPAAAGGWHQDRDDDGYRHHYRHHHHGYRTFHRGWHGHRFHSQRPIFAGCWRWVPTRFGHAKVWICD
jgi:hypothetical protein